MQDHRQFIDCDLSQEIGRRFGHAKPDQQVAGGLRSEPLFDFYLNSREGRVTGIQSGGCRTSRRGEIYNHNRWR